MSTMAEITALQIKSLIARVEQSPFDGPLRDKLADAFQEYGDIPMEIKTRKELVEGDPSSWGWTAKLAETFS